MRELLDILFFMSNIFITQNRWIYFSSQVTKILKIFNLIREPNWYLKFWWVLLGKSYESNT